ncbi:pantothenate kinase [Pseudomonas duriflava]|uniref:Pantothenate kinase n=1 Tax=Pseudomonas duriflava TaxID=459528 RepID=A0A562PV12_9PSED|nr:nucleoside/nucleotide kinase family protein [Pseudomonas duriflava]TWI48000.1 pantothenate kinase [Pseudomonas duriflava]
MPEPLLAQVTLPPNLVEHAEALIQDGRRHLLGIAGPPGSGKSTLAELLAASLGERAIVVPMDGFHLANRELARLGRADRKGAPDTFDAHGYRALLKRLRQAHPAETVYAPAFHRDIEEAIAGSILVPAEVPLVISEGNYLLLDQAPWAGIKDLFDECWYVAVDDQQRRSRLVNRHIRFGRSQEAAEAWVDHTDEPNARLIAAYREHADRIINWSD